MGACYVVGCKSGNGGKQCHKFKISRKASNEVRKQWEKNIPKQRNKSWNFETCHLCHLHFEERYLIKVNQVKFNGEVIAQENRQRWKLRDDAVPTLFSNEKIPSYYNVSATQRKPPAVRKPLCSVNRNISADDLAHADFEEEKIFHEPHIAKSFIESLPVFSLPDQWLMIKSEAEVIFQRILPGNVSSAVCVVERAVQVCSSFLVRFYVRGKEVKVDGGGTMNQMDDIPSILNTFNSKKVCGGVKNFNGIIQCASGVKYGATWFSLNCLGIDSEGMCEQCNELKMYLRTLSRKLFQPKYKPRPKKPTKDKMKIIHSQSRKICRLSKRNGILKGLVNDLRSEIKRVNAAKLESLIDQTNLPQAMKSSILAALKMAKAKSSHGYRYATDWLLQCLLIRITSPKNYRFLRNNKILALPHPKHLSKLLKGVPCQFGFNEFVFTELEKQFSRKEKQDRQIMVVFDEIKVREGIQFDKLTGAFTGFIDYGEFTEDYYCSKKGATPEADHALVFMIRNVRSNMVQPIASFASRGAAPGHILAKLLMSAILKLEAVHCEVVGVVCDGATTNKKLWKLLGITGNPKNVVSSILNPADQSRSVHFLHDVPHIVKCVRNHLQKHEIAKFQNQMINWGYYRAVFEFDLGRDLKLAPKITKQHISTGPFQKMVVPYATQILSKTMADAIKINREDLGRKEFKGSENTEAFTRKMNDIFDILNAKLPFQGIRLDSKEFQMLEEFFGILCEPGNTFASDTTMDSLRITLQASLALIRYLCGPLQFDYVLTAKFNQDCLERFFGILRSFGGDDSHPSVISFGHLFRILSLFTPIKTELNGNIRADEETELALDPFIEELKSLGKIAELKRKEVQGRHENLLKSKVVINDFPEDNATNEDFDHDGCVLYYLCGYLASRAKRFSDCLDCQLSLKSFDSTLPVKAWTEIKSLGNLTFPSDALYKLMREYVEPVIFSQLHSENITNPEFLDEVIMALPELNLTGIGCSPEHREIVGVNVVLFYITMRCFFYRKLHNREKINAGVTRKNRMKHAKLS